MIEALETSLETSPLESLYDRVLQLEQEVSALKRNSLIDSADRKWSTEATMTAAAQCDGQRMGAFIERRAFGILGHRFDFTFHAS
jgi:hypothetical protein